MSRIGKKPIEIPAGVTVNVDGVTCTVKGPLGSLSRNLVGVTARVEGSRLLVEEDENHPKSQSLHGLMRTLVANMVAGVSNGFTKTLVITGTGYKVEGGGNALTLYLGYSKPVEYPLPTSVSAVVEEKNTRIVLKSIDKEILGDTAAKIRRIRAVEPYKGKGVAYLGEQVRRKVGKAGTK